MTDSAIFQNEPDGSSHGGSVQNEPKTFHPTKAHEQTRSSPCEPTVSDASDLATPPPAAASRQRWPPGPGRAASRNSSPGRRARRSSHPRPAHVQSAIATPSNRPSPSTPRFLPDPPARNPLAGAHRRLLQPPSPARNASSVEPTLPSPQPPHRSVPSLRHQPPPGSWMLHRRRNLAAPRSARGSQPPRHLLHHPHDDPKILTAPSTPPLTPASRHVVILGSLSYKGAPPSSCGFAFCQTNPRASLLSARRAPEHERTRAWSRTNGQTNPRTET